MTVYVLAAGSGSRWGNYRGVPKHLIEIDGESILQRTVRLFGSYDSDVRVVGREEARQSYSVSGASYCVPEQDFSWGDFGKLYCTKDLWNDSKTYLVYGDVYFSDAAVESIMTSDKDIGFALRATSSDHIQGRPEVFSVFFSGEQRLTVINALESLIEGKVPPPGGWRLYRRLSRPNYENSGMKLVIDDLTTDFDYPEDLDNWESGRSLFDKTKHQGVIG